MKKSLLALAVLAAAGAAQAQVTIYGNITQGWSNTDVSDATTSFNNTDLRSTSVLGFKGSEDLGGGLKAGFVLEGDFISNSGTTSTPMFNRKSYLELSGGFGAIQLGRVYTATEQEEGFSGMGYNLLDVTTEKAGGKLSEAAAYTSPNFMGAEVFVTASHGNNVAGTTATATGQQTGYGVRFRQGAFYASMAYDKQNISATAMDDEFTNLNFGYKVGALEARLQVASATTQNVDSDMTKIGAAYDLGAGVKVVATYGNYESTGTAANEFDLMGFAIEKNLSKRTAIYAGYRSKDLEGTASDETVTAIGIDHKF